MRNLHTPSLSDSPRHHHQNYLIFYQILEATTLGCQGCCDEMNPSYAIIFVDDKGSRVF
jgi:hypothetical protein